MHMMTSRAISVRPDLEVMVDAAEVEAAAGPHTVWMERRAAVTIQSAHRRKVAKRRVDGIRAENKAAVKIQSAQRRRLAR